jgi:hydroxypyruvate isomerase
VAAQLKASVSATFLMRGWAPPAIAQFAARHGFSAVEFQSLRPGEAANLIAELDRVGVRVALVNCGVGDLVTGGCGLSGVPGRAAEFREAFRDAAKNARVLRAEVLHIGPSRIPSGESRDRCLQQLKGNVLHALDLLSGADCVLSIEALNLHEFPDILISSPETIVELIEDIGAPPGTLAMQYDIYHSAVDGRDVPKDLVQFFPHIRHIQFADTPGRHEPGTGIVNFPRLFKILGELKYPHYVGAEYSPSLDPGETLQWLAWL